LMRLTLLLAQLGQVRSSVTPGVYGSTHTFPQRRHLNFASCGMSAPETACAARTAEVARATAAGEPGCGSGAGVGASA
jgi:hypothetical protein